jgi:hypothetical protein
MGALLVTFFVYGPRAIGSGIDEIFAALLAFGVIFAWWTGRHSGSTFNFEGESVPSPGALAQR